MGLIIGLGGKSASKLGAPSYVVAWDGASEPDVTKIPAGVVVTYEGTSYTGTFAASKEAAGKIYLVSDGTGDEYYRYVVSKEGDIYSWVPLGSTQINLSDYATKEQVTELGQELAFMECSTNANQPAKVVSAANFKLAAGMWLKVRFTKVNTSDNVTLNINGTGAHPLYLDGMAVMSNVTWNANDVLFVWFDGENYQAVTSLVTKDLLNINAYNRKSSNYTSPLSAYQAIPEIKRKMGLVVTYLYGNKWYLAQYNGVNTSSQYWENVNYWKVLFPLQIDDVPTPGSENLVKSGGVQKAIDNNSISVIGSKVIPATWAVGSYKSNGTILTTDTDANYTKIDISAFQNCFITIRAYCTSDRYFVLFDSGDAVRGTFAPANTPLSVDECYIRTIYVPNNITHLGITNVQGGFVANDNVFVIKSDTASYVHNTLLQRNILYVDYILKSQQNNLLPIIYFGNHYTTWTYINNSGVPTHISNADFCYTFIKIPKNAASLIFDIVQSGWNVGSIYDSNMDFLATFGNTDSSGKKTVDLTQYPTAMFVGLNFKVSWSNESASFDGVYRYIYFQTADDIDITDSLGSSSQIAASQKLVTDLYNESRTYGHCVNKPIDLQGKKITFFGDSITKGVSSYPVWGVITDCWAKLFCDHFGATIENLAISGDLIFDPRPGKSSVCKVVTQYAGTTDIIIVAGGTNDFTFQSYFNNQDEFGAFGDNAETSFYGALDVICNKLQTDYPNVPVIFITPINRTNGVDSEATETHTLNDYRNAIWEVATKYGYNVVDGSMLAGFPNFREATSVVKTLLLHDGIHPTDTGHRYYAECMAGIIK